MLVVIHGWSDSYDSFKPLIRRLREAGLETPVEEIRLGDYLSLDDEVTFDDLTEALNKAWNKQGLSRAPRSVDVLVHSTGALIIRHWQLRFFAPDTTPLHRLVMLGPANFGSPLAHTGRSLMGRAIRGWGGSRLFETGTHILTGLEIASSYSTALAEQDWFGPEPWYGPGRILCTVLVGNQGYSGIAAVANKPGTDGTVRVSTANLECARLILDFSQDPFEPACELESPTVNQIAFGIMDGEDHSSICAKGGGPRRETTLPAILEALQMDDGRLPEWARRLTVTNQEIMERRNAGRRRHFYGYQNTVFRVLDQYGNPVDDYVLEFYLNDDRGQRGKRMTRDFQEQVIANVHVFKGDPSRRSLYIDCRALDRLLDREDDQLYLSITAMPDINSRKVGFRTYRHDDIGALVLSREETNHLFQPNRTLLVEIVLRREQTGDVFRLNPA